MVNSVNNNFSQEYEKKFSFAKTATSAVTGATLYKVANDVLLRKEANKTVALLRGVDADTFIASSKLTKKQVKSILKNADETLKNTGYLSSIKNALKSPIETAQNIKDAVTVENIKAIPTKVKNHVSSIINKALKTTKKLKGETISQTATNIVSAINKGSKTIKGKQALTVALGAASGLILLGTHKKVKSSQNQAEG